MSITTLPTRRTLSDPAELCEAMGIPFSDEQLEAITAPLEPGVIIAGAGSGKTTVMAARVVWLVGTGAVRPDQVLGLTFTRKAAAELAERVRSALLRAQVIDTDAPDEQGEEVVMTYDAFAGRLVGEHGQRIGAETSPIMITQAARYRLASRVVNAAQGPFDALSRLRVATLTERVLALDAGLSAHLVTDEQVRRHGRLHAGLLESAPVNNRGNVYASVKAAMASTAERIELLDLVAAYRQLKRDLGVTEFADQMSSAAALVDAVPAVARQLRTQFRVVLLDEYQDTSSAQAQLLRGLFTARDGSSDGLGHAVTAVGDPFQAIYGWRGAAASNILAFHRDFPKASGEGAAQFQLTVNRRSGQKILDVANQIATQLRADPLLVRHDPSGAQTPRPLVAPEEKSGGVVRAASFLTWPEEVTWIADDVVARHTEGEVDAWSDVAVLLRRNAHLAPLHEALSERGVPVEIVGLGGLLALPEVAEVVSTLRLLDDVTANPDAARLLQGPRWRIGARDLALLGQRARDLAGVRREPVEGLAEELQVAVAETDPSDLVSLVDALADPGDLPYSAEARQRFEAFSSELAELRRHVGEPVLDQVRRVVAVTGVDAELASLPGGESRRADQLATFCDAVADYVDVDGDSSLGGLLAWLQAELDHGVGLERATPSDRNSVKLLTVHRAKGLEWPLVYVPALVDTVFPTDRVSENWVTTAHAVPAPLRGDADSIDQLGEATDAGMKAYQAALKEAALLSERRLAYVAMTRAKQQLVATAHLWQPGLKKPKVPSEYFTAALAEAERQGRVERLAPSEVGTNPHAKVEAEASWPVPIDSDARQARLEVAAEMERASSRHARGEGWVDADALPLTAEEAALVSDWDRTLDDLVADLADQASEVLEVPIPASLSATAVVELRRDPEGFAAQVLRPMPRPANRAAQLGTRFHAWLQSRFATNDLPEPLLDEDADEVVSDAQLRRLVRAFEASDWARRQPREVEMPFVMMIGNSMVRGQVDAVFDAADLDLPPGREADVVVVDWKTSNAPADPVQLAIYRLAWSRATGTPLERIQGAFVHVASGRTEWPDHLVEADELEALLGSDA